MKVEFPASYWKGYQLLDSGRGEKLERFGPFVLRRPEPKALWDPSLPDAEWKKRAHVNFVPGAGFGKAGKEELGTWNRLKKMDDQWVISYKGAPESFASCPANAGHLSDSTDKPWNDVLNISLRLGLTAFKHVGVFPEQAPNWEFIFAETSRLVRINKANGLDRPKVLNLFAYTGGASLAAKAAGADVTHLDSVRQVVTWARENMERSGLDGIRWVVEDALKFARREAKRGNLYQGIILDPPAYGHGPDGEKWKLDELLFDLLKNVAQILAPRDSFLVLNLYSNGYSATLGETVCREAFKTFRELESGELALQDEFGKVLPLSIFVRLKR